MRNDIHEGRASRFTAAVAWALLSAPALAQTTIDWTALKADPAKTKELVGKLASEDATVRDKATQELEALGMAAYEGLKAAAASSDAETKARATQLLERLAPTAAWVRAKADGRLALLEGEKWFDMGSTKGAHYGWLRQRGTRIARKDAPALYRFEDEFNLTFVGFTPGGTCKGEILVEVTEDFVLERFRYKTEFSSLQVTTKVVQGERSGSELSVSVKESQRGGGQEPEDHSESSKLELPPNALLDFIPGDNWSTDENYLFCMLPRILAIWDAKSPVPLSFRRFSLDSGKLSENVRTFKVTGTAKVQAGGKETECAVYECQSYEYPDSKQYVHLYRMTVAPTGGLVSFVGGRMPIDGWSGESFKLSTREEATRPPQER